ncbi:hypothetical protein GQ42DRAFT_144397 [Ramicandelaber brevisporus]|nr:hypothetical protein GQ42DRAFT_144397 [Ramicandelaber brevisporus]
MIPAAVAATLEGLPGLDHVLDRQAPSPVCLQSYRSYLSSTEQCADVLDFYLDVSNFVSLCRDRHRLCVMQNRHHTLLMKAWAASSRGATRQLESHSAITTISRPDLRVVVEYIYHRFIAENATHNLGGLIPPSMRLRIRQMVETDSRDDPGIFVEAAARAKQLLAAETFTRFMYARTFENMGTTHAMVRLGVGLALLLVGFSVMMSLILLDVKPRSWRWIALPIVLLAIVNMAASQVRLCPFMALGVTGRRIYEEQSWVFGPVLHPKIAQLHTRRALITMICSVILSVAIVAVFFAVPGHRL